MKYKNNPFNIRYTGQRWLGLSGSRNGFCEFTDIKFGVRAWLILMRTYRRKYKIDTISSIINRYAPRCENNVDAYIKYVSSRSKLSPDCCLFLDKEYYLVGSYMSFYESNYFLTYIDIRDIAEYFKIKIVP